MTPIRSTRWITVAALFASVACGGKSEPPPETAKPATTEETPEPPPSDAPKGDEEEKGDEEKPKQETLAGEGPKADSPARASVTDLNPDKLKQLPDGFYFTEGVVTRLPCNACAKDADCKPGQVCHHTQPCSYCNATVIVAIDGGHELAIDHPDRDNLPRYKLNERVRIVLEKKGNLRLYVKKSKTCPAAECGDTEPAKKLPKAPKGVEVRQDGERCFAPKECGPKEKCEKGAEYPVRCP